MVTTKINNQKVKSILLNHGLQEVKIDQALSAKKYYYTSNKKNWHIRNNYVYYCQWGKKKDTMTISDVLYKDCVDLYLKRKQEKIFNRLRPEVWQHTDLNLSKPTNIGCPSK